MRIVSLLPSLTELVCALGRGDELVGVTKVALEDARRLPDAWPLLPMTVVSVGPTTDVHPPQMK